MAYRNGVVRAVFSILALLAVIVGLPLALAALTGWPLPHHLPTGATIRTALSEQMTTAVLDNILSIVCWVLWAQFTWSVYAEVRAWRAHTTAARLPGAAGPQAVARQLVLAAALSTGVFA
jgi:hypothetical protein